VISAPVKGPSVRPIGSARSRSRSYRISRAAVFVAVAVLAAGTVLAIRQGAAGAPPISVPLSEEVAPAAGAAVSSMPPCTLPASASGSAAGSLVLQASGACDGAVVAAGTCSQGDTPSLVLSAPAGAAGTLY